jgi:hypothetical protein
MTSRVTLTKVGIAAAVYVTAIRYLRSRRNDYIESVVDRALLQRRLKTEGAVEGAECDNGEPGSTWRVHNLLTALELDFEAWLAMSARGLFLTYAIPSVSSVLFKTGGFNKDVDRRYADMELLIREFNENAVDGTVDFNGQPERAKEALYRINAIHQHYKSLIKYEDMLYVWSVFAITPARWMESRWSIRPMTSKEKQCVYHHWVDIGKLMNLHVDTKFDSWESVWKFKVEYEQRHMKVCESNIAVSQGTIDYFLNGVVKVPALICLARPVVNQLMSCMQDDPLHAEALGLPKSNPVVYFMLDVVLTFRAALFRWLLPPKPMGWMDRLTGVVGTPFKMEVTKGGDGSSKCPMHKVLYWPARALDFGNKTYTPSSSGGGAPYSIQNMGPLHVAEGELCEHPIYLGHPTNGDDDK